MAPKIQNKRSSVENNFPTEDQLDQGEIALNTHPTNPTIFFEDATQPTPVIRSVGADPTAAGLYARNISAANAPGTWSNLSTVAPPVDGSFGYWTRNDTTDTVTPRTANDNLSVGGDITLSGTGDGLVFTGTDNNAVERTVTLEARTGQAAFTSDLTFRLPVADGANGQALVTDGSGNLSWDTPSADTTTRITRQGVLSNNSSNFRILLGDASDTAGDSRCYVVTDAPRMYYRADTSTLAGVANFAGTATNCSRSVVAGTGLSGGGVLTANRTLNVDSTVIRTTGNQSMSGTKTFQSRLVYSGANYLTNKATENPPTSGKGTNSGVWLSNNTVYSIGNTNKGAVFGNNNVSDNWTTAVTFINGGSGSCGSIDCKKQQAPRFSSNSDRRLKSNIVDAESMLEKFEAIQVRRFTIASPDPDETPTDNVLGFIADELQEVFPDAVDGEPDAVMVMGNVVDSEGNVVDTNIEDPATSGYKLEEDQTFVASKTAVPKYQTVATSELTVPMAKAIQELIAINKDLAARIEKLEGGTATATTTRKRKS